MAKVIGKAPESLRQCTCRYCASLIEYSLGEVHQFFSRDYGGGCDVVYYSICPGCGRDVTNVKHY